MSLLRTLRPIAGVAAGTFCSTLVVCTPSAQTPKSAVISVVVPVELHRLPTSITRGSVGCDMWRGTTDLIGWAGTTMPDFHGGDYHREFTITIPNRAPGGDLRDAHFVCGIGFTATIDGHSMDFGRYDTGSTNFETDPYVGGTIHDMPVVAGAPRCAVLGGPVLPLPIDRRFTCWDGVTTGSCPCGCGNTGRCTASGAPTFTPPRAQPSTGATTSTPRQPSVLTPHPLPSGAYSAPPPAPSGITLTGTGAFGVVRR